MHKVNTNRKVNAKFCKKINACFKSLDFAFFLKIRVNCVLQLTL